MINHALYGTRRFTFVFTRTRHLFIPKQDLCEPLRFILILYSHLTLGLQNVLVLQVSHHDSVNISHPCMLHPSPILFCLTVWPKSYLLRRTIMKHNMKQIFLKKIHYDIWYSYSREHMEEPSPSCCLFHCHSGKKVQQTRYRILHWPTVIKQNERDPLTSSYMTGWSCKVPHCCSVLTNC